MILLIDIIILFFIIGFTVNKTMKSNASTEFLKLFSIILGILGAKLLYLDFLTNWIINLFIFLFNTTKEQIDFNFFYMISFLIQFFIIYYFASILAKQIKNSINLKKLKLKLGETYSIINKFAVIQVSIIRSILIVSIFIFALESFPLIEQSSENSIKISQIYNIFSKISDFIIE